MRETKMYVDELPKSCWDCPCFDSYELQCQINYADCENLDVAEERHKDCLLRDIKTHDRELVKEVCEKIKLEFDKLEQNIINQPNIISDEYAQELIQKSYYNNAHRIVERVKQEYGKVKDSNVVAFYCNNCNEIVLNCEHNFEQLHEKGLCEECLKKQNKTKDKWQKLKEWIEEREKKHTLMLKASAFEDIEILNKMQELEKEDE